MDPILNLLSLIPVLIFGGLLCYSIVKAVYAYRSFTKYLLDIGDIETLERTRRLNPVGFARGGGPSAAKEYEIILKKYEQTKDEKYLQFYKEDKRCSTQGTIFLVLAFLFYAARLLMQNN